MANKFSKKYIKKYLKGIDIMPDIGDYKAKKFGESKSVSFEIKGLVHTFVQTTEWTNGEGYDVSIETETTKGNWQTKTLSIHLDELECVLRGMHFLNKKQ